MVRPPHGLDLVDFQGIHGCVPPLEGCVYISRYPLGFPCIHPLEDLVVDAFFVEMYIYA